MNPIKFIYALTIIGSTSCLMASDYQKVPDATRYTAQRNERNQVAAHPPEALRLPTTSTLAQPLTAGDTPGTTPTRLTKGERSKARRDAGAL